MTHHEALGSGKVSLDSVRAFIAIDLPEDLRRGLGDRIDRLRDAMPGVPIRWMRPEAIHLTLRFLGDTGLDQLPELKQSLDNLAGAMPDFAISVGGLGCFPNPQRPRVLWLGVQEESGVLISLQKEVEAMCRELGFPGEKKRFSPHLTLGRIRAGRELSAAAELGRILRADGEDHLAQVRVEEVVLLRSELKPTGAVYSRLATARLRE